MEIFKPSRTGVTALVLILLVTAAYWGSLRGALGGDAQVLASDSRTQSLTSENLELIFTKSYYYGQIDLALFRPVVTLTFLLISSIFSDRAGTVPHHALNILLHCLNVLLVWRIARAVWQRTQAGDSPWCVEMGSFFTALMFAVHPVNVEAVANVAGRADLLAALGVLAGLAWHVRETGSGKWTGFAVVAASGLVGMFSKENAIVLPAAMLLFDLVFRRKGIAARALNYAGAGLAVAAMLTVRLTMVAGWVTTGFPFLNNPINGASFTIARLTAAETVWRCLALLVWPKALSWDYSFHQIPLATPLGGTLALVGLGALFIFSVWIYRRNRLVCFLAILFFVTLAPLSNLVFLIGSLMAERFLYLPSIGVVGCGVAGIVWLGSKAGKSGPIAVALFCTALTGALAARTWDRELDWVDYARLWAHDVKSAPNSYLTHGTRMDQMARASRDPQNVSSAIQEGEASIAIIKDIPLELNDQRVHSGLATLYRMQGDTYAGLPATARISYNRALELFDRAEAIDRAIDARFRRIQIAAGVSPDRLKHSAELELYRGLMLASERVADHSRALRAAEYLSQMVPSEPTTYVNIAILRTQLGDLEGAILARWKALSVEGTPPGQEELLVDDYRRFAPSSCAVTEGKLNRDCALVHRHWCIAQHQLSDSLGAAGFPEEAAEKQLSATEISGCPRS